MQIACLGECMIELSGQPLERRFGGDTLNTALYLARLLSGGMERVHYLTALGTDRLSDELAAAWSAEGIATGRVARLTGKLPGLYLVDTDATGERTFLYWRSDSAARHYFASDLDFGQLFDRASTDALYLSGITLALFPAERREALIDAVAAFKRNGGRVCFDNNYRPALWSTDAARAAHERLIALADIALLTLDDEVVLYGEHDAEQALARAFALGAAEVVVKRGKAPCLAATGDERAEVAAQRVEPVVDTCAAGDSFAAGYLASRLRGHSLAEAAAHGHALSATVIRYPGAIIPRDAMPALVL